MKMIKKFYRKLMKRPRYKFGDELYSEGGDLLVILDVQWKSAWGGYYYYKLGDGSSFDEDELNAMIG